MLQRLDQTESIVLCHGDIDDFVQAFFSSGSSAKTVLSIANRLAGVSSGSVSSPSKELCERIPFVLASAGRTRGTENQKQLISKLPAKSIERLSAIAVERQLFAAFAIP